MKVGSTWVLLFGLATFGLSPSRASAEGGQTHGGTAIVCRALDGSIVSAELLDLFEARELRGLNPIGVKDVAAARSSLLDALQGRFAGRSRYPQYLRSVLADLHPRFKLLAPNVRLELIPDVFPKISQKGCAIEQLAAFQDGGDILLDSEIFSALSPLNRLALEFHESVYFLDRKWASAKDSVSSRKLVGLLLADQWGADLDRTVLAYTLGFPRAGRYSNTVNSSFRLGIESDGSIRVTFQDQAPKVLKPTGSARSGEWLWTDKAQNPDSYSELRLKAIDADTVLINDALLYFFTGGN
jgi:hypothetical protein